MFPPPNLASPIADQLREQLSSVNWARAGLGMPLVRTCWIKCLVFVFFINEKYIKLRLIKLQVNVSPSM